VPQLTTRCFGVSRPLEISTPEASGLVLDPSKADPRPLPMILASLRRDTRAIDCTGNEAHWT
jgi:hypothetical protein